MTVLLEFPTALLDYLDLFEGIMQSADFPTPESHTHTQYAKNYASIIATSLIKIE